VPGPTAFLWRLLHVPAYRCEPCRHKYFSILPLQQHVYEQREREREEAEEEESLPLSAAK
jgi:hypothetical protein